MLPQKGVGFVRVMDHQKSLGLAALALVYKDLSTRLLEHELNHFAHSMASSRVLTATPSEQTLAPTTSEWASSDTYLTTDCESEDATWARIFSDLDNDDILVSLLSDGTSS